MSREFVVGTRDFYEEGMKNSSILSNGSSLYPAVAATPALEQLYNDFFFEQLVCSFGFTYLKMNRMHLNLS